MLPPKDYTFHFSVLNKNGKEVNRFLGEHRLENKHLLVLSDAHKGVCCKYCVLFAHKHSGHNKGMPVQWFVTSSAKLLGKDGFLESHERNAPLSTPRMFPTIYSLLQIFATLPVSAVSAERTYSTLRRLKTWLRARMSEQRLIGLCLLHAHRALQ